MLRLDTSLAADITEQRRPTMRGFKIADGRLDKKLRAIAEIASIAGACSSYRKRLVRPGATYARDDTAAANA